MRRVQLACALCVTFAVARAEARGTFQKGPYLQNVAPNAVTILWQTGDSLAAKLHVVGPGFEKTIDVPAARQQEVVVDGLAPSTRYTYEVTVGDAHEDGELATAPPEGSALPFTFIVYGDTREQVAQHRRIVERVATEVPDFILETGDLVDDGARDPEWQQFFEIEDSLLRDNVLFPAVGNHDRQGRGRTADSWRSYFAVPENSPDPERYYAYTYGNARFLVLDSNMYSFALIDQTAWLERELQGARQDASIRHIFVVMHHPPFSISLHGGQRDLRERWVPLFEKYGVDAVFSGHDHVYERAEKSGVHYLVSGGAGAPLYPRSQRASAIDRDAVKTFERVNHYLRVHVYGDLVEVTAVRVDGTVIETTSWGSAPAAPEVDAAGAGQTTPVAGAVALAPTIPPAAESAGVASPPSHHDHGIGGMLWIGMTGVILAIGTGWMLARRRRG